MSQRRITDDLQALLAVLPAGITKAVLNADDSDNLLEVILDLGRIPTARFVDREVVLSEQEVGRADIDFVVERIGDIDADNRAGLERTLHRIAAIRNRRGHIVGLTCRVGRAVYGTTDIIKDLIESGKSLLASENEALCAAFVAAHPGFARLAADVLLTHLKVPGAASLVQDGNLRLWPHLHATDGFFAAVWQKT